MNETGRSSPHQTQVESLNKFASVVCISLAFPMHKTCFNKNHTAVLGPFPKFRLVSSTLTTRRRDSPSPTRGGRPTASLVMSRTMPLKQRKWSSLTRRRCDTLTGLSNLEVMCLKFQPRTCLVICCNCTTATTNYYCCRKGIAR